MPERRRKKTLKSTKHNVARKKSAAARAGKAPKKAVAPKKAAKTKPESAVKPKHDGTVSVFDMAGKSLDTLKLDPIFADGEVNRDVVYQTVLMYQAGEREGTAATKTRGEVSGGGKKPWKQKGTGQARHGSRRSPIWRGGGVTFGPHPRDYSYSLPSQLRRKAVVEGVKDKVNRGKLIVLREMTIAQPKTRLVAGIIDTFKLEKPLFLVKEKTGNLLLASRNLSAVAVKTAEEVNALDVVSCKECVMTKAAYDGLVARLKS